MELMRGTLDLLILKCVSRGPVHGYGIARAVHDSTNEALDIQEGVLYPALRKLEAARLLTSQWQWTETGRKARYYALTRRGAEQLEKRERDWRAYVKVMDLALRKV